MALPSFLKRKSSAAPAPGGDAIVQRARTGARRRLIGAALLLAVGVIAFPILFETQPRPIPVDIPIEIPRKDSPTPLVAPPKTPRVSAGQVADPAAARAVVEPTTVAASVVPPAAAPASAPRTFKAESSEPAAASRTASSPAPAAAARVAKPAAIASAPAKAASAVAKSPSASEAAAAGRYVVQVGAFAEVTAAREVRLKVEKLGLKTYTQVVETAQGRRIRVRVGPFESQDEAGKVLARLKAAKLPGAVLTL